MWGRRNRSPEAWRLTWASCIEWIGRGCVELGLSEERKRMVKGESPGRGQVVLGLSGHSKCSGKHWQLKAEERRTWWLFIWWFVILWYYLEKIPVALMGRMTLLGELEPQQGVLSGVIVICSESEKWSWRLWGLHCRFEPIDPKLELWKRDCSLISTWDGLCVPSILEIYFNLNIPLRRIYFIATISFHYFSKG